MKYTKLKYEHKVEMLIDLYSQLIDYAQLDDSQYFSEESVDVLLDTLMQGIELVSQEDGFGTEGWEHAFGYEE